MPHRPPRPGPRTRAGSAPPAVRRPGHATGHRPRRRTAQAVTVLALGGLTAGLLLHGAADRASAPTAGPAPATPSEHRLAPVTPAPAGTAAPPPSAPPAGPLDAGTAGDRIPSAGLLDLPTAPTPAPLRPPAAAAFDLGARSTSDPASAWVVVNKALPLAPGDWAPTDLVVVAGYEVRSELVDPLTAMLAAAAADGVALELRSGFRSADYQEQVHTDWTARLGHERADEVSARPGHSEHQTGLAVDVGSGSDPACDFEACFDATAEGRWVAQRAGDFGFLVRYTAGNQAVTGYAPEGWHLRWVGTDLVAEMRSRGVTTLEELFDLPGGPGYR